MCQLFLQKQTSTRSTIKIIALSSTTASVNVTIAPVLVPFQTLPSSLARGFKYRHIQVPVKKVSKIPTLCQGDNFIVNDFVPRLVQKPPSPAKDKGQNKMMFDFPMPISDEFKLMGETLHLAKFGKKLEMRPKKVEEKKEEVELDEHGNPKPPNDVFKPLMVADDRMWRTEFATVTRNGVDICVPPGHPLYLKAKEEHDKLRGASIEEKMRLVRMAAELDEELDAEMGDEDVMYKEMQEKLWEEAQKNIQKQQKPKKQRAIKSKSKRPKVVNDKENSEKQSKEEARVQEGAKKTAQEMTKEELLACFSKPELVEFDVSNLSFPQFYLSREDLRK